MAARQQWFETLRLSIAQEHGKGWSVWEVGATKRNPIGRCRLTRMYENRNRSSVVQHPMARLSSQQRSGFVI